MDQPRVYAISPDAMEQGIKWWLTPVVDNIKTISAGYTQAHAEVSTARDSETPGWFGGAGNNEVHWATSSFLNEAEWQLRQLCDDQEQLVASLAEYRTMLLEHVEQARRMDDNNAERFRAIERDLPSGGR